MRLALAPLFACFLLLSWEPPQALGLQVTEVALPPGGPLMGLAISPDCGQVAILRHVKVNETGGLGHEVQLFDLKTRQVSLTRILTYETSFDRDTRVHFLQYSGDGSRLLLTMKGSDSLLILEASSLQMLKKIELRPEISPTKLLSPPLFFKGVVSATVATGTDAFGILREDPAEGNEIFIGSFHQMKLVKSWSVGAGGTAGDLGDVSIAFNDNGSRVALTRLPVFSKSTKKLDNLVVYETNSSKEVTSTKTAEEIGPISFADDDNVFAARIDAPRLFSKKACVEKLNLSNGASSLRFCDSARSAGYALGYSSANHLLVSFAAEVHKDFEGQIKSSSGRLDVWNSLSGSLLFQSPEFPYVVSNISISSDGSWLIADSKLFQVASKR